METGDKGQISRRHALRLIVASVPCLVGGCAALDFINQRAGGSRPATASCFLTADNPEGPFYLPNAPLTTQIAPPDGTGVPLRISGIVTGPDCDAPLAGAVVDVWQASPEGQYDMSEAYRYRGRVEADANGAYFFDTHVPGNYGSRPRHIHLRISHPQTRTLITQLYFDGDPANQIDSLVVPSLIIPLDEGASGDLSGVFDIVLSA